VTAVTVTVPGWDYQGRLDRPGRWTAPQVSDRMTGRTCSRQRSATTRERRETGRAGVRFPTHHVVVGVIPRVGELGRDESRSALTSCYYARTREL